MERTNGRVQISFSRCHVVSTSMKNNFEYLVKYSIAPAPSRDYYGLRVLQDEVKLM